MILLRLLIPQAPAEIAQTLHSNPPHSDTLRWSAREVFPFQVCTTPSVPHKSTSGKKNRLNFPFPTHKKPEHFHVFLLFFQHQIEPDNFLDWFQIILYGSI